MSVTGKGPKIKSAWLVRANSGLLRKKIQWADSDSAEAAIWSDWMFEASGTSPVNYSLTCAKGTYALTGINASLKLNHSLVCAKGSYALTGNSAALLKISRLTCATGSYALTGSAVSLRKASQLICTTGSYTLTGNDATLNYTPGSSTASYSLNCDAGSYDLSGNVATLTYINNGSSLPVKVGGDDVPRVEIWETRKKDKKRDYELDNVLKESYDIIVNKKSIQIDNIVEIAEEYDSEDDDVEVLLLLAG